MKSHSIQSDAVLLYCGLQKEIVECRSSKMGFRRQVETCFQIAYLYIARLNGKLRQFEFLSEAQEISFFKKWKPRFTSELEYFNLIYYSILFRPGEASLQKAFWKREYLRLEKFKAEHKAFLACYSGECPEMDNYYFLRKSYDQENRWKEDHCDAGAPIRTNGDPLASTFLALERYHEYVKDQLML